MDPIEQNAYESTVGEEPVVTVIGDATTPEFHAQVKVQKWDNDANFSLRFVDPVLDHTVDENGTLLATHDAATSRIYATRQPAQPAVQRIRRVANNVNWQGIEATAEYEMFNQIGEPGTMLLAHYVVEEPTIAVFDLMPADLHLDVDNDGYAKDFNYPDKSSYHPADVPIPVYDRVKLVRYYTPYTPVVNPYYMDAGIHNIDIQWHGSTCPNVHETLLDAIETVLNAHGVETRRHETRAKIYFKHGDRWVKCYSGQAETGGVYAYLNVGSSYNKAYDFYRPDVDKDIRDEYAYGLQFAHPTIGHEIVDEIMVLFAESLGVPLDDEPYDAAEAARWERTQELQSDLAWLRDGVRSDANWFRRTQVDGIEFEVVFPERPATNLVPFTGNVPKNAVAYVQAPKAFADQIAEGVLRPADVGGSLAIYHVDKQNNEYKTGKVAHIYRPIAHDAAGWSVFCDFVELEDVDDGAIYDLASGLTVRIPDEFLDNATYPVVVDPTVGYSTAGGSSLYGYNVISATLVNPSQAGWLHAISAYIKTDVAGTCEYEYAIYDGQGNFRYQVQSENGTNLAVDWQTLLLQRAWHLSASRSYILAVTGTGTGIYGNQVPTVYYDSTSGKTSYSLSRTYTPNTWPSTLSGATTQSNRQYSIYCHLGYAFPFMVGSSASMPSTTGDRFLPFATKNDATWAATAAATEHMITGAFAIGDFRIDLNTAAGSGITRTIGPYVDGAVTTVGVDLANTTSGVDTVDATIRAAGSRLAIGVTVAGGTAAASQPNRWRLQLVADSQPLSCRIITATSATRYGGLQDYSGASTVAAAEQVMPEAGTLKTFTARMDNTLTAGSFTVTLVKNGSDTLVSMVLDSTNQEASYTATTVTVAAGDTLIWKAVPSTPTAPSNARTITVGCLYDSDVAGNGLLLAGHGANNASNSASVYNNWYGNGGWNATEANVQALAEDIEVTKIYVLLSAAPGSGKSRLVAFRQNGVTTAASVTVSDTATTNSWSGKVNIARDDLINIIQTPSGTPTAATVKYGIVFNYGAEWVARPRWM